MPNKPNNAAVIEKCTKRIHALESYATPRETIAINGVAHDAKGVKEIYQASLDARAALAWKRAEVKEAMADCARADAARVEADAALKAWAVHRFGITSKEAIDFGFPPPRVPHRTVEEKARAVELAKATREARHTMGKRQRETIRGVLSEDRPGTRGASSDAREPKGATSGGGSA